jgi:Transglycosylase SLT domain
LRSQDSASAAARRGSAATTLSNVMMLGLLVMGLAIMLPHLRLTQPYRAGTNSHARPVIDLPGIPELQVPQRSAELQRELAMSSRELLDRWNPLVQEAAAKFHIPPAWLRAVMRRESGGRTLLKDGSPIVSDAGAVGVMQVMPRTYEQMAEQYGLGSDPFNPRDNVFAAAGYLRWLHGRYGFPAMFAAYNDGPGNFDDHLHGHAKLPAETRNYLKAITAELGQRLKIDTAQKLQLTRPNGGTLVLDPAKVTAVRAVFPGEYAPSVHAVISMGHIKQGVREELDDVTARLAARGVHV